MTAILVKLRPAFEYVNNNDDQEVKKEEDEEKSTAQQQQSSTTETILTTTTESSRSNERLKKTQKDKLRKCPKSKNMNKKNPLPPSTPHKQHGSH